MWVKIDNHDAGQYRSNTAKEGVMVKIALGNNRERHIHVTHEGIVIDIVEAEGHGQVVVDSTWFSHDELLLADRDDDEEDA